VLGSSAMFAPRKAVMKDFPLVECDRSKIS